MPLAVGSNSWLRAFFHLWIENIQTEDYQIPNAGSYSMMPLRSSAVGFSLIAIKLSSGTSKGAFIPNKLAGRYPAFG